MKKAIWKYEVPDTGEVTLSMPRGAMAMTVQVQRGTPVMWAMVDPLAPKVERHFRVIGTGWEFDTSGLLYVGTYQVSGGDFVFHLFEVTSR